MSAPGARNTDCLLTWCTGEPRNHELSGDPPNEWKHSRGVDELAPGYTGELVYFSDEAQACYYVCGDTAHELTAAETSALAAQLEAAARVVRARANELAAINQRFAS